MVIKETQAAQHTTHLRAGIIGDPVDHSFSPRFQQAAFDALEIPVHYEMWPTPAQDLLERVRSLCYQDYLGANVTLPHQEAVLPLMDHLDPLAEHIGAVSTIVHRDDYLYGYNTEAPALLHALHEHGLGTQQADGRISLKGYTAILLGAEEAGKRGAFALAGAGAERLIILDLRLERAQVLAADVQKHSDNPVFSLSDTGFLIPHPASIIINSIPVQIHADISPLSADVLARFDSDTFVYDMVYDRIQTHLLLQARMMGLNAANGLSALLHQEALAFTLWTNQAAPLDIMRQALKDYENTL
jgi:shikimate dehydrogenase